MSVHTLCSLYKLIPLCCLGLWEASQSMQIYVSTHTFVQNSSSDKKIRPHRQMGSWTDK